MVIHLHPTAFWLIIAFLIILIPAYFMIALKRSKHGKQQFEESDEPFELPPADAIGATVVSKRWEVAKSGKRTGNVEYYITFLTDDGETVEHEVTETVFEKCAESDTGMLVTVEGKFFDFGDGEEIEEGENT